MRTSHFSGGPFDQYGDFHQQVPHYVNDNRPIDLGGKPLEERRNRLVNAMLPWMKNQVDNVFFGLARRLKEIPNNTGGNLLDESMLNLFHEAGPKTHVQEGLTVATCGGANGRLKTGYWLDCYHPTIATRRDQAWQFSGDPLVPAGICKAGLPYIHLLNTLCQAAGLSASHYTIPGGAGGYFNYNYADPYSAQRTRPNPAALINWILNS